MLSVSLNKLQSNISLRTRYSAAKFIRTMVHTSCNQCQSRFMWFFIMPSIYQIIAMAGHWVSSLELICAGDSCGFTWSHRCHCTTLVPLAHWWKLPASTSFALSVPWVAYWLFYKGELICKYCVKCWFFF